MPKEEIRPQDSDPHEAAAVFSSSHAEATLSEAATVPLPVPVKKTRVSRRVRWKQPGSTENAESWVDEATDRDSNANDAQLRRDKPPHWG